MHRARGMSERGASRSRLAAGAQDAASPAPAAKRARRAQAPRASSTASTSSSASARQRTASSADRSGPRAKARSREAGAAVDQVDTGYLQTLLGYNARRTALLIIETFLQRMAPYGLRPVDFSTLSLITHNPGITARQLCHSLGIQPPNMVGMVNGFEKRGLVERRPHPRDRRAQGLHLTSAGVQLMQAAEQTAATLEDEVAHRLSASEKKTLMALLQKIYR